MISKDYVIDRVYNKIALVRTLEGKADTQATAWTQATGYLQALLEMEIITVEEWRTLDGKLFRAFTGIE